MLAGGGGGSRFGDVVVVERQIFSGERSIVSTSREKENKRGTYSSRRHVNEKMHAAKCT